MSEVLHEKLIIAYVTVVQKAEVRAEKARGVPCPTCGAKPGTQCGFVIADEKFGEDFPSLYVHEARTEKLNEEERKALESML